MEHPPVAEHLSRWLKGDRDAIAFCSAVLRFCHIWDDLIDRDVLVSDEQIHHAFWTILVELPTNPFYFRHFAQLHPVIQMGILNWKSANRLERSDVYEHHLIAYSIRSMITDVIAMAALVIGGPIWAEEVHYDMQITYHESFDQYLASIRRPVKGD